MAHNDYWHNDYFDDSINHDILKQTLFAPTDQLKTQMVDRHLLRHWSDEIQDALWHLDDGAGASLTDYEQNIADAARILEAIGREVDDMLKSVDAAKTSDTDWDPRQR